jgi:predicted Zn-dependent protease
VRVIDDPETMNAFAVSGGRMAIYTGIITKTKATDDEIAQVMGHEIAHALAKHGA